jgi:DUF4097 and DUF4098 domain-containing protein YvlB
MSSPNPVPQHRRFRPRSLFGPLVLIVIGIIALLHNMGMVSWPSIGWWLARYWPVVLIVWGVAKLAEYMWARRTGYPPPRLGGGSIAFLIFFVLCGMAATSASRWDWPGIRSQIESDSDVDVSNWFGSAYDFTDNFAQPIPASAQIKVLCNRGDITITSSPDSQVHGLVHKTLHTDSQDAANKLNESTHTRFQQQGTLWLLDLTSVDFERGSFNVDLQLPRNAAISLSTRRGDISVSDHAANVDASSDRGDIRVEQITGNSSLHLKHGSLTAKKISGDVTVDGTLNDSNISEVGGTLTLTGTYWGDMELSHIAKPVHFSTSRTDLQFARLDGQFNMQPDDLRASSITGPFTLDTRSKSVHLEDVSGDVHIDDRNASIEVHTKGAPGNIDVTSVHGEIDLALPAASAFQLDAQSVGGEVQSDFGVSVDNSGNTATARGTVGRGGPSIRLKADHGTIQIRKQ